MLKHKPHKGDRIRWEHWKPGRYAVVVRTPEGDDNLCWIQETNEDRPQPFIWRFKEGLNRLAENHGKEEVAP